MRAFHENPNRIHTELTFINPQCAYSQNVCLLSSTKIFEGSYTNSVDPDQTCRSSLIWVHNVCLFAYVK